MKKLLISTAIVLAMATSAHAFVPGQAPAKVTAEVQALIEARVPAKEILARARAAGIEDAQILAAFVAAGIDLASVLEAPAAGNSGSNFVSGFAANRSSSIGGGGRSSVSPN